MKKWILSARPKTLSATFSPILLAMVYAGKVYGGEWFYSCIALVSALFIQIGTNYINDYYDVKKGADSSERKGPKRAVHLGFISHQELKKGAIVTFALAFLLGIILVYRGGWPIVGIGLSALFFGWLYTATPFSLAYTGFADFFAFAYFGPVATLGTVYVQTLHWDFSALLLGMIPGAYSMALLTINNLRDRDEDLKANKKTLAVRFGEKFSFLEYCFCILLPVLTSVALALFYHDFIWLLVALPILYGISLCRKLYVLWCHQNYTGMNALLGKTAKLNLLHAIWTGIFLYMIL